MHRPGPNGGALVRIASSGPISELGGVVEQDFVGSVAVEMPSDTWAVYTGPAAPLVFSLSLVGEFQEQRVRSYLIPAGTATGITIDANLNVNVVDPFDVAEDYLLVFAFYSSRIVGTARQVVPP